MEIIQKAFHVWHDGMLGYGPEIANSIEETEIVYAHTPSKAKSSANDWKDWSLDGVDASYTDLKCRRAKGADLVMFEGDIVKRYRIQEITKERERIKYLNTFLENKELTHCYIMKRGTYYRPDSNGYTSFKEFAGIYTIQDGVSKAIGCSELKLIRISVKEHNQMIIKTINSLSERFIK